MRIDLVGTTADFRGFGPPPSLPINHLLCENPQTAGRIGEDGLMVLCNRGPTTMQDPIDAIPQATRREPWNKGKLVGAKPPLRRNTSGRSAPSCKSPGEH